MMRNALQALVRFLKREDGPTAVEYAVMLALIITVCLTAIGQVGSKTKSELDMVVTKGGLGP